MKSFCHSPHIKAPRMPHCTFHVVAFCTGSIGLFKVQIEKQVIISRKRKYISKSGKCKEGIKLLHLHRIVWHGVGSLTKILSNNGDETYRLIPERRAIAGVNLKSKPKTDWSGGHVLVESLYPRRDERQ